MKPRYKHDCSQCIFLGYYQQYDLYFCRHTYYLIPTVIARFSSEPEDYTSGLGLAKHNPALKEALRLAKEKELIHETNI